MADDGAGMELAVITDAYIAGEADTGRHHTTDADGDPGADGGVVVDQPGRLKAERCGLGNDGAVGGLVLTGDGQAERRGRLLSGLGQRRPTRDLKATCEFGQDGDGPDQADHLVPGPLCVRILGDTDELGRRPAACGDDER